MKVKLLLILLILLFPIKSTVCAENSTMNLVCQRKIPLKKAKPGEARPRVPQFYHPHAFIEVGTLRYATGHSTIFTRAAVKDGDSPITFEAFAPNVGYDPFPCTGNKLEIGYQGIGGLVYYLSVDTSRL